MPPHLTFAICTHRRNALLARALDSLLAAERPADFAFEVVVVDNSEAGEAAATVAAAAARAAAAPRPFAIRGLAAHPANISVARNAAVAGAAAPWIAFLDDDQRVAPDWFVAAARAIATSGDDILFGTIDADFEAPERATPAVARLYSRRLDLAEGTALRALGRRKTRQISLTPGNAIFRREATFALAEFDRAFGLAGGEDYDLFCRLESRGRRFAWAPALRAIEFVPAARCDPAYLRRRFYAGGQVFAAAAAGASPRPRLARWTLRARALAQAAALAPSAAVAAWRGGVARDEASYVLAGVAGKLSFGGFHPLYADKPARTPDRR